MIKAVFDTTVLVAALLTPNGLSRALIERAKSKEFELCLSQEIIAEAQSRLIKHQHLRKRYNYSDEEVAYFVSGLRRMVTIVSDLPSVQVVRDPNDDFIIATAIKAGVDYLVAYDKDLLDLGSHENIQIVSPEVFAQVLRDAASPPTEQNP
jgi:hypothetical protein